MSFERIYDQSYERVLRYSSADEDFFGVFYQKFLAHSAVIREKFVHTDMRAQRAMLKKSFYHLLVFYGSNQADNYLERIAIKHDARHLNIPPELYDIWLDCLMLAVRECDADYCDEVELAWRLVLAPGITYMKFKYAHHK